MMVCVDAVACAFGCAQATHNSTHQVKRMKNRFLAMKSLLVISLRFKLAARNS
jgi:hypothetical protein